MNEFDDRTLLRTQPDESLPTAHSRSGNRTILLIAALGLLVGGLGAWWWTRNPTPSTASPVAASGTDAPVTPTTERARELPPLHQMDTFLRALLGGLSTSPELARWLATDDLIRQMANGIDRISRGFSPARDLTVLRPQGTFAATSARERTTTIDPASYRRYDGLAALVSSVDAQSVADAYRTIQPRLDEAYRGLGRAEGGVDNAVSVALQILIDTPVVEGPIRLVPGPGAIYQYADPKLEELRPAQKQLLRMGPDNLARVQERLRQIKQAIETPAVR
ncbi:MAG: DUF3014 domain-containing protein [Vicinamibacterales bacterium]